MRPITELATQISRALISNAVPTRSWNPSLEQTLHKIGCRDSLTPSLVARVLDPHLLQHYSLALGFFNWASQQPGFAHTSLTYQSILKSLSLSRQFNAIDSLLKQLKAQKLSIDSPTYSLIINAFLQSKRTHNAFLVFNDVKSDVGPHTCNSLLAALASDKSFDNAHLLFDEMIRKDVVFSTVGFGVFVWRFCESGDLNKVLGMLDKVRESSPMINGSLIANLIVHGLCKASRVSEALWILNELRTRDCKPDFIAYRVVAEAYRAKGSVFDVNKVLKMKRKLGVAPRSNDYKEFIFSLIAQRRVSEAKELGEVIVDGNFPMQDDVLNALIGSVSSIDPVSALVFFRYLVGNGSLPTVTTLGNLSRNLLKHDKIHELLEVYRVLSLHDYFSDTESYLVMYSYLCKAGNVREAYAILQEMKKKGLDPDITMYNSLMEACCKEDMLRPAKRLWDEMFVIGCGVNVRSYNILIGKLLETGEIEEALRLFSHMLEKGMLPDATTYSLLLDGLCQETNFKAAAEVFNKSVDQDVKLARSILNPFVLNLCRKGQYLVASNFLSGLTYDIGHSDSHLVLLKHLAEAEEVPIAIDHLRRVHANSPSILREIVSELLAFLSSSSKPEPVLHLLQVMRDQCLDPNNDTFKYLCANHVPGYC
ncbi:hypothetical protein K2173_004829 [Erythroxylum novogranatense]|uniref:Pentatricopeptide repeat-containing protein n=1 Tax=Erythroxylum novogranatense TaxID=1862640 RepID=A0AAV8SJT2_9ROSI|nr:hypothetical protein K2173_004829 [Erythroxylum novogranatense]